MNKYWFKLKINGCETTARLQVVMWADTLEEAEDEINRIYLCDDVEHFTPTP